MKHQYGLLFKVFDDYVRTNHRCFVSECFLSRSEREWLICVQPLKENARIVHRYAYKYFMLSLQEVATVCSETALTPVLMKRIDEGLVLISDRYK